MLKWKITNNTISKLYYHGQNIINPWGIETADSSAFFSIEKGIGYRYEILNQDSSHDEQYFSANFETLMKEGQWHLQISDKIIDQHTIRRKAKVICLKDSYFMDFVMRFRFKKKFITYAQIADAKYSHRDTNRYNQHPVREVSLQGNDFKIQIDIVDSTIPEKMKPYMYVRDAPDEWVVHVRMLPEQWDKEVIKVCNQWAGTRPLPLCISRPLLNIKALKKTLWYRNEIQPYKNPILKRLNLNAFPMVKLAPQDTLMWKVNFKIK